MTCLTGHAGDIEEANSLLALGKYKQAKVKYLAVIGNKLNANDLPVAQFGLAKCHAALGESRKAVDAYEALIERFPSDGKAPEAAWGILTLKSGPLKDRKGALEMARTLSEWKPATVYNERALYSQGVLYHWDKKPKPAKAALELYLQRYGKGTFEAAAKALLKEVSA